ncbi:MAG: hypothetical protein K2X86_03670 [Cytophagaceae bacterium]|nr:hypothetical protein [Cytophagaceae bacterium]
MNIGPFNQTELKIENKAAGSRSKALQQFLLNRNHPLRKATRPIIKPFKSLLLKSGAIDILYKFNRKKSSLKPISAHERKAASSYFSEDLNNLKEEFQISFPQ